MIITRTLAGLAIGLPLAVLVGCGGGPSSPSGQAPNRLQGVWNGTLTIIPTGSGQPSVDGLTRWTFTGAGVAYKAAIQSSNPLLPLTDQIPAADAVLASATGIPVGLITQGSYPCTGRGPAFFSSEGQVTSETTITATFHGVDCTGSPYDGSVRLTLSR